jgi:hypothetical protein
VPERGSEGTTEQGVVTDQAARETVRARVDAESVRYARSFHDASRFGLFLILTALLLALTAWAQDAILGLDKTFWPAFIRFRPESAKSSPPRSKYSQSWGSSPVLRCLCSAAGTDFSGTSCWLAFLRTEPLRSSTDGWTAVDPQP